LDHLTEGLVSSLSSASSSTDEKPLAKQYIPSLLVSQAGTHMLEAILAHSPPSVFEAVWELYFVGKLGRLAGHPMGNYVVAKGVGRLDVGGLEGAVKEVQGNAGGRGLISTSLLIHGRCQVRTPR
jgi:nucleolar protein 9